MTTKVTVEVPLHADYEVLIKFPDYPMLLRAGEVQTFYISTSRPVFIEEVKLNKE